MKRLLVAAVVAGSAVLTAAAPASAIEFHGYYTKKPYSGFYGIGRHTWYCDYIKYPKRHCVYKTHCHHGKCYKKRHCRTAGYYYKQRCY